MMPKTWLQTWFHRPGRNILRMVAGRYLGLPYSIEPTADAEMRAILFVVPGGTGVADALMFCRKNSSDTYECASVDVTP